MHVLVIPSWYPSEDAPLRGVYLPEQLQALKAEGVNVGVVYPEHRSLRDWSASGMKRYHFQRRQYDEDGVPTYRTHGWNAFSRTFLRFSWIIREAEALADWYAAEHGRPDLIHAHSALWAAAAARRIAAKWELPYVVTEHFTGFARDSFRPSERAVTAFGLEGAARILTVSESLKRHIRLRGFPGHERTFVLPNSVNTELFTLPDKRESPPPFRWLGVTTLNPRKGVDILLDAFARPEVPDSAELDIIGGGPELERLQQKAFDMDFRYRVRFHGSANRGPVAKAMQSAHAFVLPSRYETFGIPLIEAMATGLPVVATRCGGPSELVTEKTGLLAENENPISLAFKMRELQEKYENYDADVIRASVVDQFSKSVVTKRLLAHYREVQTHF